jgi:hypothetical protein
LLRDVPELRAYLEFTSSREVVAAHEEVLKVADACQRMNIFTMWFLGKRLDRPLETMNRLGRERELIFTELKRKTASLVRQIAEGRP